MRILVDECLDWRLCRYLPGHDCQSVQQMGWNGLTNGALLRLAEQAFDLFITGDKNLSFQQNISNLNLAVIVLEAHSMQLRHTAKLMAKVLEVIDTLEPGQVISIAD